LLARPRGALARQLAWRLVLLQALFLQIVVGIIVWQQFMENVSYISDSVNSTIVNGLSVSQGGHLIMGNSRPLRELIRRAPALWFVAQDEQGRRIVYGVPPTVYQALIPWLPELAVSDIHSSRAPYSLTMRIFIGTTSWGKVHVMSGGVPSTNIYDMLLGVSDYLIWHLTLPVALLTLITIPLIIRRVFKGVRQVADQARSVDINQRGTRLPDEDVPLEIRPLVLAFNAALARISEDYNARDRFLSSAAHELRAPIAVLSARVENLQLGAARVTLLRDITRLANLAEQLLDLQRLGKQHTALTPMDLVCAVKEVISDVAPLAVEAGYELEMVSARPTVMVLGDLPSLSRVVTNLLQNAIAHGGGQGLIKVSVGAEGEFEVTDAGPGIPLAERTRIFEPFYRVRPTSFGSGLGLHLVKEIVDFHGGRIEVAEAANGGACFRVTLRLAQKNPGVCLPAR
jgi:signal transduction histidine kinase